MPIFTQTDNASDATIIYTGADAAMRGWDDSKHGPLMIKVSYIGCVLSTFERNMYDDSDFIARVWNGESIVQIEYASTRFWTYANGAKVDATPEVMDAARAWQIAQNIEFYTSQARANAAKVGMNKRVKVIKGRKIAKGTTGTVIGVIRNDYDQSNPQIKLQLDTKDGSFNYVMTYQNNLQVENPEDYMATEDEIYSKAVQNARI